MVAPAGTGLMKRCNFSWGLCAPQQLVSGPTPGSCQAPQWLIPDPTAGSCQAPQRVPVRPHSGFMSGPTAARVPPLAITAVTVPCGLPCPASASPVSLPSCPGLTCHSAEVVGVLWLQAVCCCHHPLLVDDGCTAEAQAFTVHQQNLREQGEITLWGLYKPGPVEGGPAHSRRLEVADL